jgi:hypothetical protein
VWKPGYISKKRNDDIHLHAQGFKKEKGEDPGERVNEVDSISSVKISYVVIGPLSTDVQIATGE